MSGLSFDIRYIVTPLIEAASNTLNSYLAREQQERLSEHNQALQIKIEENRQHFQIKQSERNAELQRELSQQNHQMRLLEQQLNFENLCKQEEWNHFLNTWPLINLPSVIRAEQILPDDTVSLRVIFARNNDPVFARGVYPRVEQGLREFVDLYHNEFQSKNIIFYQNGFSGSATGGAVETNIHYALRELPVIIIDCNILLDEICVSLTMWGFGSVEKNHFTVFKLPYEPHITNGIFSVEYYSELTDRLLSHLKFVLGCAYDAYNLIQYNRPPLLPRIADYEHQFGKNGCLLNEPKLKHAICETYSEIYSTVIGEPNPDGRNSFARLPESFRSCILHKLRMEYADAMRDYLTDKQYIQYLNDSADAWTALRTNASTETFLRSLASGKLHVFDYVGKDDRQYLEALCAQYDRVQRQNLYSSLVKKICKRILQEEHDLSPTCNSVSVSTAISVSSKRQKRRFNL